jgi:hypothetical protein
MSTPEFHRNLELLVFAQLVHQLRAVQKEGGKGYRTPAVGVQARSLEQQVDDRIASILGTIGPLD